MIEPFRLGIQLVVPGFLIFPVPRVTEHHPVGRGAQRQVDRIVDAAQTESTGGLRTELDVVGRFEGDDDPWRGAARVGRVLDGPRDFRARYECLVRERTGEQYALVLAETVVAQSCRQGPLRGGVPRGFAKGGILLQPVAQIRIERGIGRSVGGRPGCVDQCIIPRCRQILAVPPQDVLEEAPDQPVHLLGSVRAEADFLGQDIQGRPVIQRRVDPRPRFGRRNITEDVHGHATRQLCCIAQNPHVAVGVGRDGRQRHGAEVIIRLDVRQRELIQEAFALLGVLLQGADVDRIDGRVGIRQDVVQIDPGIAVRGQILVDEARCDGEMLNRFQQHCQAHTRAIAVVDVAFQATTRLDGIDESRQMMVVDGESRRRRFSKGDIDGTAYRSSLVTMLHCFKRRIGAGLEFADLRLPGDIAHGAGLGAGAEQGSLRATQHLESIDIEQLQVRREQRHGDR